MPDEPLLPLFPLEMVLLPGAALPLHIFEERYKLLAGEAIEGGTEFGIVLIQESSLQGLGCTARVEKVLERYPDGRLDIVTRGQRRFEILFLNEEKPYLQAAVHFFDDETQQPAPPEALQQLSSLLEQATQRPPSTEGLDSFQIAGLLPLDLQAKQQLLALRSEGERVALLIGFLKDWLPRLQRTRRMEQVARGNGQG